MLYIKSLTAEEIITLEEMYKKHPRHLARRRAHSLLLSNSCYSISEICEIYSVCRQTVSTLFNNWENYGICGLLDKPGRGRHCILNPHQQTETVEKIKSSPRTLKPVIADLENNSNISVSSYTLKRLCKKNKLVWKRVRKSLRSKRDQAQFDKAAYELSQLIQQDSNGEIDLLFFDEAGFSLEPCIPYAWQPVNHTIEIPSSKSKRLNVLGFIKKDCQFNSFVFEGSVTSAVVISCLDQIANKIKKETVIVIDNAPIHTSKAFNDKLEQWKEKNLTIFRLPKYSPELNIIEILWRKIKYEWLPFKAYESFASLKDALFNILSDVGKTYKIVFT